MIGHFIRVCECGIVLDQCRCAGPKRQDVQRPCRHDTELIARVKTANRLHPVKTDTA